MSFGGLFALYALFEKPELFYGYLSIPPGLGWDDSYIVKREREVAKDRFRSERRLWLSFGDAEEPERVKRGRDFVKQLEKSRHEKLALATRFVQGERHAGVKNESYHRGLRFVLAPLAPNPSK